MSHVLIFGMTESGKTTLAKRLAARWRENGSCIIILDSLNDPGWECGTQDFQTSDPDEFIAVFWASRRCAVFIDEAGDAVGRYNTVMQRTATRGRHWGHSVHFISQRGVQISPTVRDQCSDIYLLTSSLKDGKVHADEWNQPTLAQCNALGKGNYFHATRFGTMTRGSLFGSSDNGLDTDTRDGRRNVSGEQAPASPAIEESAEPGDPGDPSPIADRSDASADLGPGNTTGNCVKYSRDKNKSAGTASS